jgi:hypothetical protein
MLDANKIRQFAKRALAAGLIASLACTFYFFLVRKSPQKASITWETRNEAPNRDPRDPIQPDALEIIIRPRNDSTREKMAINVTVTNISNRPVGWDSEFSCFLYWDVWQPHFHGLPLKESPARVEQTKESLRRERFVIIAPGDHFSGDVTLTDPFKAFRDEGGGDGDFENLPDPIQGYEIMTWFELPNRYREFSIRLEYQGSWPRTLAAFKDLFGFDPDQVKIRNGSCSSNVLDIKIND